MKKDTRYAVILILAVVMAIVAIAAARRRDYPVYAGVYRGSALTTSQTEIILPNDHIAQETIIINRGTGKLYFKYGEGTICTSADLYVKSGEAWPVTKAPWSTLELLAADSSAEYEISVLY